MKRILLIFMSVMLLFASFAALPAWADTTAINHEATIPESAVNNEKKDENDSTKDVAEGAKGNTVNPTKDTIVDAVNMVVCIGEKNIERIKILNGKALVPLRAVFEAFGCSVRYTQSNGVGTVGIQRGITTVSLQENNPYMTVNDLASGISTPLIDASDPSITPKNVDGSIYIPAKAVAEALFCNVWWFDPRVDTPDSQEPSQITIEPRDYSTENCHHDRFMIVKRVNAEGELEIFLCDRTKLKKIEFEGVEDNTVTEITDLTLAKNTFPLLLKVAIKGSAEPVYFYINSSEDGENEDSAKAVLFSAKDINDKSDANVLLSFFNEHNKIAGIEWKSDVTNTKLELQLVNGPTIIYNTIYNTYSTHTDSHINSYVKNEEGQIIFEMEYVYNEPGI